MRLETAMSASKEGLNVHGKAISVVSDNISNANTTGYKSSRAEFSDILAATGNATGGMTMSGCGASLQSVKTIHTTGSIENTGRTLDLAIGGEGFFLVGDAKDPSLTRAGNFQLNPEGYLVNADGSYVLGLQGSAGTELGPINMIDVAGTGEPTTTVDILGNLQSNSAITAVPTEIETFKDLNALASFSSSFEVFDSLGDSHTASLYFYKTASSTWQAQAYVDSGELGQEAGTPVLIGETTLSYDGNGQLVAGTNGVLNASLTFQGANPSNIAINLSKLSQFASNSGFSSITPNGKSSGEVLGYNFTQDGGIYADLSSGDSIQVGKLQLGNVNNIDGLERSGGNLFGVTANSGELIIGNAGENLGTIEGSSLEISTVDLASEFVNLVVLQRGYQANSSVLSNVSELIRDTISLIR